MSPTSDSAPLTFPLTLQGQRMDAGLAQLLPQYSRTQLTEALKQGKILINGAACKPKEKIKSDESIDFNPEDFKTQGSANLKAQAIPLTIAFEDDALMIINKPAGLTVHPGAGRPDQTLVNGLLHYCQDLSTLPRAGIIHRLDQDTTGLLLVAKTAESYLKLTEAMRNRCIKRHYLALAQGRIIHPQIIETFYGRDSRNRLKMAVKREGKLAITHLTPQKTFSHFTLLRVALETGRTHQIRVHCAHIKHPIVGDPLYGRPPALPKHADPILISTLKNFGRQALHAYELEFEHPWTQKLIHLQAPLPDDFQNLLTLLEHAHDSSFYPS
jgi:23S rRNA pseudouridine1911/1915/1917 synthase